MGSHFCGEYTIATDMTGVPGSRPTYPRTVPIFRVVVIPLLLKIDPMAQLPKEGLVVDICSCKLTGPALMRTGEGAHNHLRDGSVQAR